MVINVLLLLVGFVLLIKGADFFVDGSSSIARHIGIPSFVVGLTIVAMGTSAPEAAVSITAGIAGSNALAISNVMGSNMFNLLVVAGACAVIKPYTVEPVMLKRDFPVNVIISFLLIIMMAMGSVLGWINGLTLLVGIVVYVLFVVLKAVKERDHSSDEEEIKKIPVWLSIILIIGGLAMIIFGGDLVVDHATAIATKLGWSEAFIGLTIVAIGTSLPELVTTIVAARKGESGLALGNVIGSNIFNILFILGLSSSITAIPVDTSAIINAVILLGVTALVYVACLIKKGMGRAVGAVCVIGYVGYTVYLLLTAL